jgi:hypothetical protein
MLLYNIKPYLVSVLSKLKRLVLREGINKVLKVRELKNWLDQAPDDLDVIWKDDDGQFYDICIDL